MRKIDRKTILFIHHGATLDGASICLSENIKRMDKARYKILVLLPGEGPFSDLLKKEGIEYKIIPLFNFYYCSQAKTRISVKSLFLLSIKAIGNIIHLSRIIRKDNPDAVIINTSTLLLCGVIARIMKKRVIWHIREVISTEKSRILKKIITAIIRFSAEKIIVASEYSKRDMSNLKMKNTIVVYDGAVDLQKFRKKVILKDEFNKFELNPTDKIVGFVGQIYHEKGWRNLVKTAFLVTQKISDVKFLIVGKSSMMERENAKHTDPLTKYREDTLFHQMVNNMKLDNNFVFLGQRFDVENILSLMKCLVFPSIVPEVFGRVMTEAMASGLPVIASDIGASREIVVENVTGLLVEPDNPKALSNAIIDMLTNEEKAKDMGERARRRAEEFFDIEKFVPQLLKVYEGSDLYS